MLNEKKTIMNERTVLINRELVEVDSKLDSLQTVSTLAAGCLKVNTKAYRSVTIVLWIASRHKYDLRNHLAAAVAVAGLLPAA